MQDVDGQYRKMIQPGRECVFNAISNLQYLRDFQRIFSEPLISANGLLLKRLSHMQKITISSFCENYQALVPIDGLTEVIAKSPFLTDLKGCHPYWSQKNFNSRGCRQ